MKILIFTITLLLLFYTQSFANYNLTLICSKNQYNEVKELISELDEFEVNIRHVLPENISSSIKDNNIIIIDVYKRQGETLPCCIARDRTEEQRRERERIQSERLAVIGRLAAGVAHEINNPLGIVRTNADIAGKLNREPAVVARLEAIRRNVERASAITRRLLRLSVPDSLTPERVDMAELVRESLRFLHPRLKNVELDLSGLPRCV